ncbi:CDP-alcohol phosphatidyltransferase family protein [Alphaproteobacteria bacterium endosymbiont of Tiliacea citrago]|uniref:CDP-alcohol phosphatidyltransferase family protein n=1 Tax=Alphaproteobacteria bacterium endosymbiont of Tiliacea citrago TaxID=3077944 RepID=UPI00313E0701
MIHHILTSFRVIISPFMMYFLYKKHMKMSIFLSIFAIFCDVFDGFLARVYKKESNFGAVFDVFADKLFLYLSTFGLLLNTFSNKIFIVLSLWFFRDICLLALFLTRKNKFNSLKIGKIHTALQFIFILTLSFLQTNNYILLSAFFVLFFITGIFSVIFYIKLFFRNE